MKTGKIVFRKIFVLRKVERFDFDFAEMSARRATLIGFAASFLRTVDHEPFQRIQSPREWTITGASLWRNTRRSSEQARARFSPPGRRLFKGTRGRGEKKETEVSIVYEGTLCSRPGANGGWRCLIFRTQTRLSRRLTRDVTRNCRDNLHLLEFAAPARLTPPKPCQGASVGLIVAILSREWAGFRFVSVSFL